MTTDRLILAALLLTTGCATGPQYSGQLVSSQHETAREQPEHSKRAVKAVNLTPLSGFADDWAVNAPKGDAFSDSYTRIRIKAVVGGEGSQDKEPYPYNPRWWLRRALIGKDFSISLTAKLQVGAYEATVPLAIIGHQSNSDGEQWTRELHHSLEQLPLFLVKSDGSASVPSMKFTVKGSKSYTSRGAAAGLSVALGVARATAASVPVITRLSEQTTKQNARAIDEALSKLFGSGITEEHWTDRDLREWSAKDLMSPRGVRVTFYVPKDEQDWNAEKYEVGTWVITFDYPRPSIFSDVVVCPFSQMPHCSTRRTDAMKAVFKDLHPSQVLNYMLINGSSGLGTIRAFLAQQDWYAGAMTELAKFDRKNANSTASLAAVTAATQLCRKISNEITGLGLNGLDAGIVVWAVSKAMPLPGEAPNFAAIADCRESIQPIDEARQGT